jgi:hypothetical protein
MRTIAKTLSVLVILCPALALAGAPLTGSWNSTDLGGIVPVGRYTEGWANDGGALLAGTVFNAASWDGVTLGDSWAYSCAVEANNAVLISDTVSGTGFGNRTWMKTFAGGTIWLSGAGPWANGDAEYVGSIIEYVEYETITYVAFNAIAARTNVSATASIDGYDSVCLGFTVGNGAKVSDTASGPAPANYPALLTATCSPTAPNGAFWNLAQMTLYIANCSVATEEHSWGSVKALFR